jgi:cytochrome c553
MSTTALRNATTALLFGLSTMTATAQTPAFSSDAVERVTHICSSCHGVGGNGNADGQLPLTPKLAGQPAPYLAQQLRNLRAQKRADSSAPGYMWSISALLEEPMIEGLADYYATQTPTPGKPGDAKLMEQGKIIYTQGVPADGVMACAACHGQNGEGNAVFPRLAGQNAEYIVRQSKEFLTRLRPHAIMSERVAKRMTNDEVLAVAAYLQAQ